MYLKVLEHFCDMLTEQHAFLSKQSLSDPIIVAILGAHLLCTLIMLLKRRKESLIFSLLFVFVLLSLGNTVLNNLAVKYQHLVGLKLFGKDGKQMLYLVGRPAVFNGIIAFILILCDLLQSVLEYSTGSHAKTD